MGSLRTVAYATALGSVMSSAWFRVMVLILLGVQSMLRKIRQNIKHKNSTKSQYPAPVADWVFHSVATAAAFRVACQVPLFEGYRDREGRAAVLSPDASDLPAFLRVRLGMFPFS